MDSSRLGLAMVPILTPHVLFSQLMSNLEKKSIANQVPIVIDESMDDSNAPATQPESQRTDELETSFSEIIDIGTDYGAKLRAIGYCTSEPAPHALNDEGAEASKPHKIDDETFMVAHITIGNSDTVTLENARESGCRFLRENERHIRTLIRSEFPFMNYKYRYLPMSAPRRLPFESHIRWRTDIRQNAQNAFERFRDHGQAEQ
jgi:hypothetical protein